MAIRIMMKNYGYSRAKERNTTGGKQKKIWIIAKNHHMVTTGFQFEGYEIVSYLGVVAGEVVLVGGFLSEFTSSFC